MAAFLGEESEKASIFLWKSDNFLLTYDDYMYKIRRDEVESQRCDRTSETTLSKWEAGGRNALLVNLSFLHADKLIGRSSLVVRLAKLCSAVDAAADVAIMRGGLPAPLLPAFGQGTL